MNRADELPRVVHVYLDEPGGGPVHVALLREVLGDAVRSEAVGLNPRLLGLSPVGWILAWREIARRMGSETAILHAHGVRAAAAIVLPARRSRVPLLVTVHGLHALRRSRGPSALAARAINRFAFKSADRVLVTSEADRQLILERRLAAQDRVHRIHPVHRPQAQMVRSEARQIFGLGDEVDVLLWLGRMAEEKDPITFIRALKTVEGNHWIGLLVGDGPLFRELRILAEAAGLLPRIRLTGWMQDPSPAFAASDVFVSTSKWEGFPMAALEAAAAGLPLVLTDCPGNRDVVASGIPAVLVPPGDDQAVSREVGRLLEDPELRQRLGRESLTAVARLTPERLREEMLATYGEIWKEHVGNTVRLGEAKLG
jgi:glycosyltransferase EpsD